MLIFGSVKVFHPRITRLMPFSPTIYKWRIKKDFKIEDLGFFLYCVSTFGELINATSS